MNPRRSAFGPWTTAISPGNRLELSAFWRVWITRLTMRGSGSEKMTHAAGCGLFLAALLIAAVPTFGVPAVAADPPAKGKKKVELAYHRRPERHLPAEAKLEEALRRPTNVDFVALPLVDVLTFVDAYHDFHLKYDTDETTEMKIKALPPVTLRVNGISARLLL
jgi:hypothetical protein